MRADRDAQIAEQLQSNVVRMAGSMKRRSKRHRATPAKEKARHSRVDRKALRGVNHAMLEPAESTKQPEVKKPIGDFVQKTAEEVRGEPVKSLVWAFFVGIFLTIFPVGRILGLAIGVVIALIRPILLLLGVVKLCEEIETRRKE